MALPNDFGLVYEQRKRALGGARDATLAQNAYSRFLSTQRGDREAIDYDIRRSNGLHGLGTSFFRRGLGNSGLFKQGQTDYSNQWLSERNDMMEALRQKLAEYDFSDAAANANYNTGIADLEAQKLRDIMATAADLA